MRLRALLFTLMAFAGWLLLSAAVSAQPVNVDAAKKEGKLVIYGTIVPKVMALIQKGFEAQYGIKVEYWRGDATKVIDRVLTEWRAGKPNFDVVLGARGPLALAKPEGVFAKYSPPGAANFPAKFKDKDGQFTAMRVTPVGILYNTELVKGPGIYPNIKGADKIMDSLLLMNDASSERLAKLQSEFRQLFVRK